MEQLEQLEKIVELLEKSLNVKSTIEWEVKIKSADNGFVVEYPSPNGEGNCIEVIEADEDGTDSRGNNVKAIQKLVYTLFEAIGYYGSKHDKERVFAEIVDQTKDQ